MAQGGGPFLWKAFAVYRFFCLVFLLFLLDSGQADYNELVKCQPIFPEVCDVFGRYFVMSKTLTFSHRNLFIFAEMIMDRVQ